MSWFIAYKKNNIRRKKKEKCMSCINFAPFPVKSWCFAIVYEQSHLDDEQYCSAVESCEYAVFGRWFNATLKAFTSIFSNF